MQEQEHQELMGQLTLWAMAAPAIGTKDGSEEAYDQERMIREDQGKSSGTPWREVMDRPSQ